MAIAHDGELVLAVLAAAETVRRVGQSILMQAAGGRPRCRESERGGRQWRQPDLVSGRIDQRANAPDERTGNRDCPTRACDIASVDRHGVGKREASAEKNADLEVRGKAMKPCAGRPHLSVLDCRTFRLRNAI